MMYEDLDDVEAICGKDLDPFNAFLTYGSCHMKYLLKFKEDCLNCKASKNVTPKLQDLSLNVMANSNLESFFGVPLSLCNKLMLLCLEREPLQVTNIIRNWPVSRISLNDVLSDHVCEYFGLKKRMSYAMCIFKSFIQLILKKEPFSVKAIDLRGVLFEGGYDCIHNQHADLGYGSMILKLLSTVRAVKCDIDREIILDFRFSAWCDTSCVVGIFKNNPRVNNESRCKLQIHFGHLGFVSDTPPWPGIINLLTYATPRLESLELINYLEGLIPVKDFTTVMQKTLELPNYQNLFALSFCYNYPEISLSSFSESLGNLPQLRSLNLSFNNITCLKSVLYKLKNPLLSLRLSGCELDSKDLIYLMNSVHSKSILELDISGNSFSDEVDLGTFLSAFHSQLVVLDATGLHLHHQAVEVNLSTILQTFVALRYISLHHYPFSLQELISVIKVLCGSTNMKTLNLDYNDVFCFGSETVSNVESIMKQHNGQFYITKQLTKGIWCVFSN
ncbi:uncharacterized protein LOC136029606 [Artemia franciscana]|uniref:Leucine-rich repeat-containing protein 14 n=1 Tax=Artemia franciscana TaxID=6661 RepID=A0AA88HDI3_ARTSF|nr:hypothetical protein QYM36_014822 [Artemia franciscana]